MLRNLKVRGGEGGGGDSLSPPLPLSHSPSLPLLAVAMLCLATAAQAAIWPDEFAGFKRTATRQPEISQRAVWEELGLDTAETARYEANRKSFSATLYRLKDPTCALAAFQWQRPADADPSQAAELAAENAGVLVVAIGNYLLRFEGYKPQADQIRALPLPALDRSRLPDLPDYLPAANLVPNSERFIIGPASLAAFQPGISPSTAAFRLGAEAQVARYTAPEGELQLVVLSYPTPDLARERKAEFDKLPGAIVKRTGPYLAVVMPPANPDAAERLLAKIEYKPTVSEMERVPTQKDNIGNLILNILLLTGILLAFAVVAGMAFGGWRVARRWLGTPGADEAMIRLRLDDR